MLIDVIILITLAGAIFIGKIRGLNACVLSILSLFLALILAIIFYKSLGDCIIDNTNMDEHIKSVIKNSIQFEKVDSNQIDNYPEQIKEYVGYAVEGVNSAGEAARENISSQLSVQIIYVISYVIILIGTKLILLVLKVVSKVIEKIPVLKQINEIGGAICGFIEGALAIYIIIAVMSICSPMMKDSWIISEINQSYVGKSIYNNNILANNILDFK